MPASVYVVVRIARLTRAGAAGSILGPERTHRCRGALRWSMMLGYPRKFATARRVLAGPWPAVVLFGLALAAIVAMLIELREDAVADARGDLTNLALVMGAQTSALIEPVDLALREVRDTVAAQPGPNPLESFARGPGLLDDLRRKRAELPRLDIIAILDAGGRIVASSLSRSSLGVDLSDRDYVQYFKANDDAGLFVGLPEPNRSTNVREIFLARRLAGPHGEFRGVVMAAIAIARFDEIFRSIQLPHGESFALARRDGTLLLRHPETPPHAGNRIPAGSPWHRLAAQGGGFYSAAEDGDDVARLVAVQPLPGVPLVVSAAADERTILARWRNEAWWIGGAAAVMFAYGGYLFAVTRRQFGTLRRSRASLRRQNHELKQLSDDLFASKAELAHLTRELEATLETMDQGLMLVDADGNVQRCNSRAQTLLDLPPELVAVRPSFHELLEYQWKARNGTRTEDTFEAFVKNRMVIDRPFARELVRADGRVIELRSAPMAEGGFVRTYTDITARKRAEDKVRYLALHDELTRLVKRAAFHDRLAEALATADEDHCVAVMCLDLDRFKEINDTRGHRAGDELLARAAERMRGCVRASDLVARLGGDEFAVLLTCLPTPAIAAAIARDLLTEIAAPYALEGGLARIGVSIGIAFAPQDASKVDLLLQHADAALYEAKRMGRGRFRLYGALEPAEPDEDAAPDARTAPRTAAAE